MIDMNISASSTVQVKAISTTPFKTIVLPTLMKSRMNPGLHMPPRNPSLESNGLGPSLRNRTIPRVEDIIDEENLRMKKRFEPGP